jgi:hypothetical protein
VAPSICKKLALTSPTSGVRLVGIFRSRTQATKFKNILHIVKILLVLVCYINHSSGYVSYCETGYCCTFLQYAGNNMKLLGSRVCCAFQAHAVLFRIWGAGNWPIVSRQTKSLATWGWEGVVWNMEGNQA